MEEISTAYIRAVVTACGFSCTRPGRDFGIDLYITRIAELPDGGLLETGLPLRIQVKSTTRWELRNTEVIFDMDARDYNKLAKAKGETCLLLFCFPEDDHTWVELEEDALRMRGRCFWHFVETPPTGNTRSQRLRIPQKQIFDFGAVSGLMLRELK